MFFLIVGLYFSLTCLAAWLVFFPAGRAVFYATLENAGTHVGRRAGRLKAAASDAVVHTGRGVNEGSGRLWGAMRRHSLLLAGGMLVICVPPLIALLASSHSQLEGFNAAPREMNLQITELLKGEQLVAPAPLPPAIFATQEVLVVRPMLNSASRNWDLLDADFKQRLLLVFKLMKERYGYDMALLEGYRSPERQNALASLGSNVTNAAAFQSYHQYGLAGDCAFLRDGKLVISEKDPWAMRGYELFGEIAEAAGLTWGGRWKMMDFGHAELRRPGTIKK